MAIRDNFPPMGSKIFGGESNGLIYKTAFFGTTLAAGYEMVVAFLNEQGYEDVIRPKDAEELKAFLAPPNNGVQGLFEQPCYAHNPIRISFVRGDRKRRKLELELYNEVAPNHLLRFHRRENPEREAMLLRIMEEALYERYGDVPNLKA